MFGLKVKTFSFIYISFVCKNLRKYKVSEGLLQLRFILLCKNTFKVCNILNVCTKDV